MIQGLNYIYILESFPGAAFIVSLPDFGGSRVKRTVDESTNWPQAPSWPCTAQNVTIWEQDCILQHNTAYLKW